MKAEYKTKTAMTNNFKRAFKEIINIEGGYVNNPNDMGGETKYGISKRAYPNRDIRNLTLNDAMDIYYVDYWFALKLDYISDYIIQLELFDTSVNMGRYKAATILQESLNMLNRNGYDFKDLKVDGVIGVNTLKAYEIVNKKILLKVLNGFQFCNYVRICKQNKNQEVFFNGWMKRV